MILKPEPIFEGVESIGPGFVILLTPQGERFNHEIAKRLSCEKHLIFICGHYEGVDERVRIGLADLELSIGDYILTGGELPCMVVVDAVVRLLPGVLGNISSVSTDSFYNSILDYPQYTRPAEFRGMRVPDILLSGNHEAIKEWRKKMALERTRERRPDLLRKGG
jgi:tRNA (guanine37-N1)-methyltransferase